MRSGGQEVEEEQLVRRQVSRLLAACDPAAAEPSAFWGAQFDHGLAWVGFPEGCGGLGVTAALQGLVDVDLQAAGAPVSYPRNPIGVGMAAPTLMAHGSDEQRRRWLRPAFTCNEVWCQLYSERAAGSDLAGVATSARRGPDGGDWVVDGVKLWVTLAHRARWGLLLARTDPDAPKHRGITCFVVDMHAPGVEIHPLRQMTGEAEFDEVHLTAVAVPDSRRLGAVDGGWTVALTTLLHERVAIGGRPTRRDGGAIGEALRIWKERGHDDPVLRDRLVELWMDAEVVRLTNLRALRNRRTGTPGPEGAIAKLASAELNQRVYDFCVTLLGGEGMLYDSYALTRPTEVGLGRGDVRRSFLRARGRSLEGGSSEIMRTILGERVLGLPPEPRLDKDGPWSQVPRN